MASGYMDHKVVNDYRPSEVDAGFFEAAKPPEHLEETLSRVGEFLAQLSNNTRIILLTSGGTTVPLEKQMVRFLDNSSAGTRGAISCEWFLRRGCAVIFLHRQYSLTPFARHYRYPDERVLDMFDQGAVLRPEYQARIASDVEEHQRYRPFYLPIRFYTVSDYLLLLQQIAVKHLSSLGNRVIIYLAAAVSDFYLPESQLANHKIQSDNGTLTLQLEPVPKVIRPLVKRWCPKAFIVTFKLETDPALLLDKAHAALKEYENHVIIANLLSERRTKVTIIRTNHPETTIEARDGIEIEELVVDCILDMSVRELGEKKA